MTLTKKLLTKNACYMGGHYMKPKGIMVHSTGANNPKISRYSDNWNIYHPEGRDLGAHTFKNDGNGRCLACGGRQVAVHAFIGKTENGSIGTCQTLPWDTRGWHSGGDANQDYIGFEICEDALADATYFNAVYREAVELCAMLCKQYDIAPEKPFLICHSEGYKLGVASNHSDVMHWFPRFNKSMYTFRADVKKLLESGETETDKIVKAMKNAGVSFDENTWRRVLDGGVSVPMEYAPILLQRVLSANKFTQLTPGDFKTLLAILLNVSL